MDPVLCVDGKPGARQPQHSEPLHGHASSPAPASNLMPSIANFSIQYNFTSASIAVSLLKYKEYLGHPLYAEPTWASDVTLAAVFCGAMLGMLFMGRLGDLIGRGRAMRVTLSVAIVGTLVPACAFGSSDSVYVIVSLGRLILGIGVGGIYPLSAVKSAEGSADPRTTGKRVAKAFWWQSVGTVVPYLFAMILLAIIQPSPPQEWVPQMEFRFLFAVGALPALFVLVASMRDDESSEQAAVAARQNVSLWTELKQQPPETFKSLAGTAGAWFIYDVAYYGTSVFTPTILGAICMGGTKADDGTCSQTLFTTSCQSVVVNLLGVLGCLCAITQMESMGSKRLNVYGFSAQAIVFAALGLCYQFDRSQSSLLFGLFCLLTFCLNFGPSVGTFVLPAVCFPAHIRSTCHGLSAFGGKVGALVGSLMFPAIQSSSWGLTGIMYIQATLCVVGVLASQFLLKHDLQYLNDHDKIATVSLVHGSLVEVP